MREPEIGGFTERLESPAGARRALLEKFKPKPTVQAEVFETRAQREAREVEAEEDAAAAVKQAAEDAETARLALANNEEAQLEMKRADRKDRKAAAKAEARAKREAKSAQRR